MINRFLFLLHLSATLASVLSTAFQGSDDVPLPSKLKQVSCTLIKVQIEYGPTKEHPKGYDEESWICELSEKDASIFNVVYVEIDESPVITTAISTATSGNSVLTISKGAIIVVDGETRLYSDPHARAQVHNISKVKAHRAKVGPPTKGVLKTLMIRMTDRNGVAPNSTVEQLENDVFDDAVCLKTHMEACSYDQLKIQPFQGVTKTGKVISHGVVDLQADFDINEDSRNAMRNGSHRLCKEHFDDCKEFDLVMFCVPPGQNFLAFANVNSKNSWYNDKWCGYSSAQMHEVGHNLGLAHSGGTIVGGKKYADTTGVMGFSSRKDDTRKCFNPAKSYQLGWYSDKVKTLNPLETGTQQFTLNGVSDYQTNENALIVLRLNQISLEQDYYITFNRADGINEDTSQDERNKDEVIIVQRDGPPENYGQSWKVGALKLGQTNEIEKFDGNYNITIKFKGILNDKDATVQIFDSNDPPTIPPRICKTFTIEVNTDGYPQDNSWVIMDTEDIGEYIDSFVTYTEKDKRYNHTVCLPLGEDSKKYKFTIYDKYGDGMCCGQGRGSYKAYDPDGNVIFSEAEPRNFRIAHHFIDVPALPSSPSSTPTTTANPTSRPKTSTPTISLPSPCEDSTRPFLVNEKARKCDWVSKATTKKRCAKGNGAVATNCPKTCGTCGNCVDAVKRFYLPNGNLKSCLWVKAKNTIKRCNKIGDNFTCRATCGHC